MLSLEKPIATEEIASLKAGSKDFNTYAKSNLPRKIEALFEHKDFQPRLSWIAKALNVTLDEVQDAIDLLESLGIITWKEGQLTRNTSHMKIYKNGVIPTKDQIVDNHRIISHQLLNDIDPNNRFFVHNGFTSSDTETLNTYYKKLLEVQDWFIQTSKNSKNDILVGYSFTGANVMTPNSQELS